MSNACVSPQIKACCPVVDSSGAVGQQMQPHTPLPPAVSLNLAAAQVLALFADSAAHNDDESVPGHRRCTSPLARHACLCCAANMFKQTPSPVPQVSQIMTGWHESLCRVVTTGTGNLYCIARTGHHYDSVVTVTLRFRPFETA